MKPIRIYDYMEKTRAIVLDAVRSLPAADFNRTFEIGLGRFDVILTHIWISEWYYVERMKQSDIPSYSDWPVKYEKPPELDAIVHGWSEQAKATRAFITAPHDWDKPFTYTTAPEPGETQQIVAVTFNELFTQLAFHEIHHRSQLMAMLRQCGKPVGEVDFNMLMYERTPVA